MSGFAEAPDPVAEKKKELMMLQAQRDALETEASAIAGELNSPGPDGEPPVGVKGRLVDSDGFPLAGFDLFNVREKRHRLNCIQTDHKAVMAKIEKSLHALHEAQAALRTPSASTGAQSWIASTASSAPVGITTTRVSTPHGSDAREAVPMVPIAKVNQVSEGSPAATAGLAVGDLVLRFGSVDISHPKGMGGVVDVVRENEGREVPVTVLRHGGRGGQSGVKELTLVPRTWSGRGLLGVHLLPP